MLEKDLENLIAKYPNEFFPNEGLELEGRQVMLGRCRADIIFKDKHGRRIIIEIKMGTLTRDASGQIIEYYGLLKHNNPNNIIELVLCANNIPRERKTFLVDAGIECKEISHTLIDRIAKKYNYQFIDNIKKSTLATEIQPPEHNVIYNDVEASNKTVFEKNKNAILFSVNPSWDNVKDGRKHLEEKKELYWEVGFKIIRNRFDDYPIYGFMHINKDKVKYVATIKDIIPFSRDHYENEELANRVKPANWIKEWRDNAGNVQEYNWKYVFVITLIEHFSYPTLNFKQFDGRPVTKPPENYTRVLIPEEYTK